MAEVPVSSRVDVNVSIGAQPISTASFNSALFLAELTDAAFPNAYQVYETLSEVVSAGFLTSSAVYKFAALAFGGKFPTRKIYVVKYGTVGVATPLTPVQAITNMLQIDDEAYFVSCQSHTEANVTALASFCEGVRKLYVHSTQVAGVLDGAVTNDVASVLQDASYNHALTLFNGTADSSFAEGGIVGAIAAIQAGVSTLEDKTMVGVAAGALTPTQRSVCEDKNVVYYMPIAGVNSVFNSKVASGQFADTIIFSDWLDARLKEEIYGLLKRESDLGRKVSMDESGFAKIREACWRVINVGLANGSVSNDVAPIVRTPEREEILDAQRAARELPNVVVELLYSNAVHKVTVRAYVSI